MTPEMEMIENRKFERHPLMLEAKVTIGNEPFQVLIYNISAAGAKLKLKGGGNMSAVEAPFPVVLDIPEYGDYEGDIVWTDDEFFGINFHENHKTMVKLITGQSSLADV
jgi:hypothetical protein